MPYTLSTREIKGAKKYCMTLEDSGKTYCYSSDADRKEGMKMHEMFKHMPQKKQYKYEEDRKMHDFGDIDDKKKVIRINPRKGDVINTLIHEELHRQHPDWPEKKIEKRAFEIESDLSIREMRDKLTEFIKLKSK